MKKFKDCFKLLNTNKNVEINLKLGLEIKDKSDINYKYLVIYETEKHLSNYAHMAQSYLRAADEILLSLNKGNLSISKNDELIFPLIFLLRHSLECSLKSYLMYLDKDIKMTHKLKDLWGEINKIMVKKNIQNPNFKDLEIYFSEFDEIDSGSDAFRYFFNKKNEIHSIYKCQIYVDIEKLFSDVKEIIENIEKNTIYNIDLEYKNHLYFYEKNKDYINTCHEKFKEFLLFLDHNSLNYCNETRTENSSIESDFNYFCFDGDVFDKIREQIKKEFSIGDLKKILHAFVFSRDIGLSFDSSIEDEYILDYILGKNIRVLSFYCENLKNKIEYLDTKF